MSVIKRKEFLQFMARAERQLAPKPGWIGEDFNGHLIYPQSLDVQKLCRICNLYVYNKQVVGDICPACALAQPRFEVEISFGKSPSRDYEYTKRYMLSVPQHMRTEDNIHTVRYESLKEFCGYRNQVGVIVRMVGRWKSSSFKFNGNPVSADGVTSLYEYIDYMRDMSGAKDIAFDDRGGIIFTHWDPHKR